MKWIARSPSVAVDDRAQGREVGASPLAAWLSVAWNSALEQEIALRRPFLWAPVAAGAGALLYFAADREPVARRRGDRLRCGDRFGVSVTRPSARFHRFLLGSACICGGFVSASWRSARVDAPIIPRVGIGVLTGFVEELDPRRAGARFVLRVASAEGLPGDVTPRRVRLTTRGEPQFAAGDFIALKARLLPPAHAALPGGYDFARDAYFAGNRRCRKRAWAHRDPVAARPRSVVAALLRRSGPDAQCARARASIANSTAIRERSPRPW